MPMNSAGAEPPSAGGYRCADGYGRRREASGADAPVYLKWIDAFESGSAEIDALHRQLIEDSNGLLLLVETDAPWPTIVAQASKLVEDCIAHFHVEEDLLCGAGFSRCAEHAADHRHLERTMRGVIAAMERVDGALEQDRAMPRSLGPALVDVIIRHDLDFRSHLLSRQGM